MEREIGRIITQSNVWSILSFDIDLVTLQGEYGPFTVMWDRLSGYKALIQTDDVELLRVAEEQGVKTTPGISTLEAEKESKSSPQSYSSINTFHTCPKQYEHVYILKDVECQQTTATLWGTKIHGQIETWLKGTAEEEMEDAAMRGIQLAQKLRRGLSGDEKVEWQWGLDKDWQPAGFKDKNAVLRGVIDWVIIDDDKAVVVDWKTGKRKEDTEQVELFALAVFCHFPGVGKVRGMYAWLAKAEEGTRPTIFDVGRDELAGLKEKWLAKVHEIDDAMQYGVFPEKKSGLCHGWCPVRQCAFWTEKRS